MLSLLLLYNNHMLPRFAKAYGTGVLKTPSTVCGMCSVLELTVLERQALGLRSEEENASDNLWLAPEARN